MAEPRITGTGKPCGQTAKVLRSAEMVTSPRRDYGDRRVLAGDRPFCRSSAALNRDIVLAADRPRRREKGPSRSAAKVSTSNGDVPAPDRPEEIAAREILARRADRKGRPGRIAVDRGMQAGGRQRDDQC